MAGANGSQSEQAIVKQAVNKAVTGDPKATVVVLNEARFHESQNQLPVPQDAIVRSEDQRVMDNLLRRIRQSDPEVLDSRPPSDPPSEDQSKPLPEPEEGETLMPPSTLSREEYQFILRRDFASFIERSFYELNPQTPLLLGGHIEVIATKAGGLPPGKNQEADHQFAAASFEVPLRLHRLRRLVSGALSGRHVICASYGQDLADKLARDCRNIMMSAWYKQLFPHPTGRPVGGA